MALSQSLRTKMGALRVWIGCLLGFSPLIGIAQDSAGTKKAGADPQQQSKAAKESTQEIVLDCQAVIDRSFGLPNAQIDLADVDGGRKYLLKINLVNPYQEAIQFSSVTLSCGCGKFVADSQEIPALGSANFKMQFQVPNLVVSEGNVIAAQFAGLDPAERALMLRVEYTAKNVFGFLQNRVDIEIPKSERVVSTRIPIRLVPPMTLDKLKLEVSEHMKDLAIDLVGDDTDSEMPYIRIEAAKLAVPRHGIQGNLRLHQPESKQEAYVQVHLKHRDSITLRPESIRLARDNHSKPYEFTAMLRVQDEEETEIKTEKTDDQLDADRNKKRKAGLSATPQVGLTIGGETARVQVKPIGQSDIYQVNVRFDGPLDPSAENTVPVRWRIVANGEERIIDTKAFISKR